MRVFVSMLCTALAAAAGALRADTPALTPTAPAAQAVLRKGTTVRLRLLTDLRSGQSKAGEAVRFTVDQNVFDKQHHLLLAKGAAATGQVTASTDHDPFYRQGRLTFVCSAVRAGDGTRIPIKLVVGGSGGAAEDAATETDAQEFWSFSPTTPDPDGYVQAAQPGGYYFQHYGDSASIIYDPGRFFSGSREVTVRRGQIYKAKVAADTSVPVVPQF